jgi:hypothetical protein
MATHTNNKRPRLDISRNGRVLDRRWSIYDEPPVTVSFMSRSAVLLQLHMVFPLANALVY